MAGLLFHENKVLVDRLIKNDFYAFSGGRVEMFETTIVREMSEELGINVK